MYENLELVLLALDEVIDQGHIVELDASAVISRVLMRSAGGKGGSGSNNSSVV